ncbi:MAG: hypothetical protein ACK5V3_15790 [Bdellovibrionales bacterium]
MKQNVMNQTAIFESNENEWLITNPFWKSWRLKVYEFTKKLASEAKRICQIIAGLWLLRTLGSVIRGLGCVLFVAPPQQQKCAQGRFQALQYRNLF